MNAIKIMKEAIKSISATNKGWDMYYDEFIIEIFDESTIKIEFDQISGTLEGHVESIRYDDENNQYTVKVEEVHRPNKLTLKLVLAMANRLLNS